LAPEVEEILSASVGAVPHPFSADADVRRNTPNTMTISFEVIPAIDLKGGKCVRLQEGIASRATEYGDDPLAMALHWQEQGATRLHLVDLDGAFRGETAHLAVAKSIFQSLRIPVQFGGGVRTSDQIKQVLNLGADRVILGTVAVEHPELVEEAVRLRPHAIVAGIDARGGRVALRGWVDQTTHSAVTLALRMKDLGVERVIYTDVSRDGMLTGVNVDETEKLSREAGIKVIASGGVSGEEDVRRLWERREAGIEGAILGRALYEKKIDLKALLRTISLWQASC
jgi:phosphoribosylformimino-5-aminoimidazole carboxamide ribotide isomerase